MKVVFILSLLLPLTAGEIRGVVEDGTRGGEGTAQVVNLVRPAAGMQIMATATNVTGAFTLSFEGELPAGGPPVLLQAIKDGVTYTQARVVPDNLNTVRVFDADPEAKYVTQMGYTGVYAYEDKVELLHFFHLDNIHSPPKTKLGGEPALRFRVPEGYTDVQASIQRGTMPLRQPLAVENGVATADFALHPGRTTFVVRYTFSETDQLSVPLIEQASEGRLVLMPMSMDLESESISLVNVDNDNNMKLYTYAVGEGADSLELTLSGQPDAARGQAVAGVQTGGQQQQQQQQTAAGQEQGRVDNTPNRIDRFRWAIIGTVLGIMGLLSILAWKR